MSCFRFLLSFSMAIPETILSSTSQSHARIAISLTFIHPYLQTNACFSLFYKKNTVPIECSIFLISTRITNINVAYTAEYSALISGSLIVPETQKPTIAG